jgi:hypothetical protein
MPSGQRKTAQDELRRRLAISEKLSGRSLPELHKDRISAGMREVWRQRRASACH